MENCQLFGLLQENRPKINNAFEKHAMPRVKDCRGRDSVLVATIKAVADDRLVLQIN